MKTFATVVYAPGPGLPARARLARLLVGDGEEVEAGAPLLALEPLED
jgi:biotin carboxyl carrier protein